MRGSVGYSLIEMVVVMVIVAILAAIAIPRFTGSETSATWYHEQVTAAVRYAQRQAVAQRRTVYVCVAGTDLSVSYVVGCGDATAISNAAVIEIPRKFSAPSGVSLSSSPASFSFNPLGQPTPLAGATVTLTGHSIVVTAETGYVVAN